MAATPKSRMDELLDLVNKRNRESVSDGTFQGTPLQAAFVLVIAVIAIALAVYCGR